MTRLPISAALVAFAFSVVVASQQQQAPVFRTAGDIVPVYVTVTDRSDRLVTTLTRENFEVFDNGRQQPLTLFDNTPQPIRLVVLLDVSGSMLGNLPILRAACEQLFARLRPGDLARVGSFGHDITISPAFTANQVELVSALPVEIAPNAPTPLWRAIDEAMTALAKETERRVVLVLSDGKDGAPFKFGQTFISQLEIVDRAQREEVMIYGVGLRSRGLRQPMGPGANLGAMLADDLPDPGLGTVAIETGGGYLEIRPRDDLGAAFTRVADELHSQYLLGFAPPARDGKRHKIEVKLTERDLKPRARKNYVAPQERR